MFASDTALAMIGTRIAAIDASIALHALIDINDADAVAACTLNPFNSYGHAWVRGLWAYLTDRDEHKSLI
jgi:hypothetical protein